ncbi:GNAT family N-acetyltransferase [Pedobacter sp. Hv1]|uniref:GNAT family N-acetyltransferase n=1 Tax=Pedobacter sp. Hv1 TaxID=1740090 RepID=UPI0006D8ABFE|nr:GNAT family N-acetyltransferase [Pedobacter sp. Hv1]KQB98778.1 GNAT family acetyltransferase [Pedobacter sp. Hv1]
MQLTWVYKNFNELTTIELFDILHLRCEVFIVEQNCVYQDIDGKDKKSFHLMAWNGNELVAYTRLVPPGISFEEASIGRVITSPRYRGLGVGITLIEKSIEHTLQTYHTNTIKIGAQLYLKKFYSDFGFEQCSDTYLEDGIPHIDMLLIKP